MPVDVNMPSLVSQALSAGLEGVSRKDLAARAEAISLRYRAKGGSQAITSELDALAYALVRMPATYAAVRRALAEAALRCPGFAPDSLLDIGAGPGTAAWAARETWPSIARATLIDCNPHLLELSRRIAANCADGFSAELTTGAIPAALDKLSPASLVIASYSLAEIPARDLFLVLERLWSLAGSALLIVEPGSTDGFQRILRCREWLIAAGAQIAAPCTHHAACQLAGAARWCHFCQRLPRSRDHLAVKSAEVNYEDEKFSYLFAVKAALEPSAERRILSTPFVSKQSVRLSLCAPGVIEERTIERKQKETFKKARHYNWGDAVDL